MTNISNVFLKGFTLLEMAVVLGVLGILVAGTIASFPEERITTKQVASQQTQETIKKQLMTFALINKYLPCPDSDTPPDGKENRDPTNVFCSTHVGTVPYLEIGLRRSQVQDPYQNFIRYAINQNAVGGAICDNLSSASYFCNTGGGQAVFTLVVTPPLKDDPGTGNYFVCNNNAATCNGTPPNAELHTESASVVLVAYNEDGYQAVNNCGGESGANLENCDHNVFYHQRAISTEDNNFFDDTIVFISGYEIKAQILSPITVWTNVVTLAPTYTGYSLNADDNYVPLDDANTPDVIQVNHNVTTALNLGAGDDQVIIGNDLSSELIYDNQTGDVIDKGTQAELDTGEGDDTVYIVGVANSNVILGDGNDVFVLGTNLTEMLSAGSGNDKIWIQADIESTATFTLGEGDDVVWLGKSDDVTPSGLSSTIEGGDGYDILVLESMTQTDWDTANGLSNIAGFELVIFKDDGTGTREHITLP